MLVLGNVIAPEFMRKSSTKRERRIEAKVDRILAHLGIPSDELAQAEARAILGANNRGKCRAISAYQEATGADLPTAKAAIERLEREAK